MSQESVQVTTEDVLNEIQELETNQHSLFFKHEARGRERMAFLLLRLNVLEEEEKKIRLRN